MAGKRAIIVNGDEEFEELALSLGYQIVDRITVRRKYPKYYMGRGKVEELKNRREEFDILIINDTLKVSQWFNLEKELGKEVCDKIKLIIDVFAERAKSAEAKLQVELARLNYLMPMVREIVHQARRGEHPGFMGGGEYEVSQYYLLIRKRAKRIREKIEKLRMHRELRRSRRKELGFFTVAVAGYANSGKSTLVKNLCGEERVVIDGRMFSTLSTKTTRLGKEKILLTDTVGFISDLPHELVESFRATIEEIYEADLIILLLDSSEPLEKFSKKFMASLEIIPEDRWERIIVALNKIDRNPKDLKEKIEIVKENIGKEPILISAKYKWNLDILRNKILEESSRGKGGGLST